MKKVGIFLMCILLIRLISASNEGTLNIQIKENPANNDCQLNFNKGWNFFSFCRNLVNNKPSLVFSPIEKKYRYVMKWDSTNQEFELYSPKSSKAPIPDLNDNESYFIYLYDSGGFGVEGNPSLSELRYLVKGWNAPSYQLDFSISIDSLISPIKDKCRYVMKWDSTNQEFELYSPKSSKAPFQSIDMADGLFIYSNDKSILIT